MLLAHGADINATSQWEKGGFSLLESATPEQAQALMARGAVVNVFAAAHLADPEGIEPIIRGLDWTSDLSSGVVAVMYGYFDDSGTDDDSPVAVMAGYVAHMADWKRFENKTKKMFGREGVAWPASV